MKAERRIITCGKWILHRVQNLCIVDMHDEGEKLIVSQDDIIGAWVWGEEFITPLCVPISDSDCRRIIHGPTAFANATLAAYADVLNEARAAQELGND